MVKFGKPLQEIKMMMSPGDNIIEIITGRDRGARQQKQYLVEPIHDTTRFPIIVNLGEIFQQDRQPRTGAHNVEGQVHGALRAESAARMESQSNCQHKIRSKAR